MTLEEKILHRLKMAKITNTKILGMLDLGLGLIGCSLQRTPERFKPILPNWRIESQKWLEDVVVNTLLQLDALASVNETIIDEQTFEYHVILLSIVNALTANNARRDEMLLEFSDYHVDVVKVFFACKSSGPQMPRELHARYVSLLKAHIELRRSERASLLEEGEYEIVGGGQNGERIYQRSGDDI